MPKAKSCKGFRYDNRGLRTPCLGIAEVDVGPTSVCGSCFDLLRQGIALEFRDKDTVRRIIPNQPLPTSTRPEVAQDVVVQVKPGIALFEGMLGWVKEQRGARCLVAFAWPDVGTQPEKDPPEHRIVAADLPTADLIPIGEIPIKLTISELTSPGGTPPWEGDTNAPHG